MVTGFGQQGSQVARQESAKLPIEGSIPSPASKKYRLIKQTFASGYVQWNVEKKVFWWWEFVYGTWEESKARKVLEALQRGEPYITTEVQPNKREDTCDEPW